MTATPGAVIGFWFGEVPPEAWFRKDPGFDALCDRRFGQAMRAAIAGRHDPWAETADGSLALVILLDQMPRNILRDTPGAFASDPAALAVARRALDRGFDLDLPVARRLFLYLPFQHSESLADQERCVMLCSERLDDPKKLDYACRHRDIIARFGRFPHRNAILGRTSTAAEEAFLGEPGSSF